MTAATPPDDLARVLELGAEPLPRRRRYRIVLILITVLLATLVGFWMWRSEGSGVRYRALPVERGDLVVTVTATGTLQPVDQVDVGSELSGTVEWVGVDFNDRVVQGQVLARLDTKEQKARVVQGRASLEVARARVAEAEATVVETRLRLDRCLKLLERHMCTQEDADNARAAWTRAKAGVASATAQVEVAEATLAADETKLEKAVIVAPINGLVLARNIEPGQTVASMMQTPILFTLAEDLSRLELHVDVDEADVGQVQVGQTATFTVDAHPDRTFEAEITQVRFAPRTVQGVVTYETLLSLANPEMLLRPGMTATAEINVAHVEDALLVPNAALRFRPPDAARRDRRPAVQRLIPGPPMRATPRPRAPMELARAHEVWMLRGDEPVAFPVVLGATDGRYTQLLEGDLDEGDEVIVEASEARR